MESKTSYTIPIISVLIVLSLPTLLYFKYSPKHMKYVSTTIIDARQIVSKNSSIADCSISAQEKYINKQYSSAGYQITKLILVKSMDPCIYDWHVVSLREDNKLMECDITTYFDHVSEEIKYMHPNCSIVY